ncbi:hypothetical protein CSOJ01_07735 [Colletotrichum sojae]|uniref:Uncharacterized protein n=1 Tax=Colletotrichum sojae TaxID=2175907 RepID=A0A8H6MT75_9PEZI|nr:hypothetical protein CSOJ01_07735 [Colletotrichum sojae]
MAVTKISRSSRSQAGPGRDLQRRTRSTSRSLLARNAANQKKTIAERRNRYLAALFIPAPSPVKLRPVTDDDGSVTSSGELPDFSEMPFRDPTPLVKSPRILISTQTFRWVKTREETWLKVPAPAKKSRIILRRRGARTQKK